MTLVFIIVLINIVGQLNGIVVTLASHGTMLNSILSNLATTERPSGSQEVVTFEFPPLTFPIKNVVDLIQFEQEIATQNEAKQRLVLYFHIVSKCKCVYFLYKCFFVTFRSNYLVDVQEKLWRMELKILPHFWQLMKF